MTKEKKPIKLIVSSFIFMTLFAFFSTFIIGVSTPGGEQKPLIYILKIGFTVTLIPLIITLISPFYYKTWFIRRWWITVISAVFFGYLTLFLLRIAFPN